MLFECISFEPAHESKMRGSLVYKLIVKYLPNLFKFSHSILDWTALSWIKKNIYIFFFFFLGELSTKIKRSLSTISFTGIM